jgi:hypothetical protein
MGRPFAAGARPLSARRKMRGCAAKCSGDRCHIGEESQPETSSCRDETGFKRPMIRVNFGDDSRMPRNGY